MNTLTIDMSDIKGIERVPALEAQAKALQDEAHDIGQRAAQQIGERLPCPDWCTAAQATDRYDRVSHEWHWGQGLFSRFHRGIVNGHVLEQVELLYPDGSHRTDKPMRTGKAKTR